VTAAGGYTTGDIEPMIGLGGPPQNRVWFSIDYWVGVSEYVAVAYTATEGVPTPVSVVVYAPPSAERLRSLSVGELSRVQPEWPHWEQSEPPTPDQLRNRWLIEVVSGQRRDLEPATPAEPTLVRREGQTPDEFYAEVARVYRTFRATTSKPTTSIAKAAGVSRNTAAQWVYHARKRGYLAAVEKGEQ
jgi:hypothetical protein